MDIPKVRPFSFHNQTNLFMQQQQQKRTIAKQNNSNKKAETKPKIVNRIKKTNIKGNRQNTTTNKKTKTHTKLRKHINYMINDPLII